MTPPVVIVTTTVGTVISPVMTAVTIVVTVVVATMVVITLTAVAPRKWPLRCNLDRYLAGGFLRHIVQQGGNQICCVVGLQKLRRSLLVAVC